MQALTLNNSRHFALLGKLLINKKPEVAKELYQYLPAKPIESDFTKIPQYFKSFCKIQNIETEDIKANERRIFIAAIILLYNPKTRLLLKHLSETIKQFPSNTSVMIEEVEFRYRKVEEFRNQVDEIVKKII